LPFHLNPARIEARFVDKLCIFMFRKKHNPNLLTNYLQATGENLLDDLNFIKKHRRRRWYHNIQLVVYTVVTLVLFFVINILVFYPSLKTAYTAGLSAKTNLLQSTYALRSGQFTTATEFARLADADWQTSMKRVTIFSYTPVAWLPGLRPYIQDAKHLVMAGYNLNQATLAILESGQEYLPLLFNADVKYSELTSDSKGLILRDLYNSQDALAQASTNLAKALSNLEAIKNQELLNQYQVNLIEIIDNTKYVKNIVDKSLPLTKALPKLAGYPVPSNYLFILQNQDELRPTGGFIGTIGLARVSNGNIIKLETHDVYHLDMPATGKVTTVIPPVLQKYLGVNQWFLRDANWSPDWPTSVQKILELYTAENAVATQPYDWQDFDFVIGLTPQVVVDLMNLTGPVRVGGQMYWPENMVDLLQDSTGKDFNQLGYSRWDRKNIVGQIALIMELKLLDSLADNWGNLFSTVINNLDKKNILLYSQDYELQQMFSTYGWTGQIDQGDKDYVMVVDANLAALKTDAVINRRIDYELTEDDQGLTANLTINYANNGSFSWKTTRYRSYTRVYVPLGSKLLRASGYMGEEVTVGEELGKTYFGAFVSIEPGTLANLSFSYELPEKVEELAKLGKYELLIQKQPGSRVSNLKVDLNFKNKIELYKPAIFYAYLLGDRRVRWDTGLEADRQFSVNF